MNTTQVIQSTFIVLFPPCAARPSRCTTNCLLAKLTGCAPLGEFNSSEAILKVDFCFQINLTGSAQFRTSQKILGKFEIEPPQLAKKIAFESSLQFRTPDAPELRKCKLNHLGVIWCSLKLVRK
jgi:hypothetical protein